MIASILRNTKPAQIASRRPPERPCFLVSRRLGEGVNELLTAIEIGWRQPRTKLDLSIDASDGAGISWLHRMRSAHKGAPRRALDMTVAGRRDQARHRGVAVRCGRIRP